MAVSAGGIVEKADTFAGVARSILQSLMLDDFFIGILKGVNIIAKYPDGFQESLTAMENGIIKIRVNRGPYVDLKLKTEFELRDSRIFIELDDISTKKGAWQRLMNLGYANDSSPPLEPSEEDFVRALEEFQSEHGLPPTGEFDNPTQLAIKSSYESTTSYANRIVDKSEDKLIGEFGKSLKDSVG